MLEELYIKNIILIEESTISFGKSFNVISGETGSGKSAILKALSLILGARADGKLLRTGAEKGIVRATFKVENRSLLQFLQESGIEAEENEPCIIQREIFSSGESRLLINNQPARLKLLTQFAEQLVRFSEQRDDAKLLDKNFQRGVVDEISDLSRDLQAFSALWKNCIDEKRRLVDLKMGEEKRLQEQERVINEIDAIEKAELISGEEEELFTELSRLTHTDKLLSLLDQISEQLSGERAILDQLQHCRSHIEEIVALDSEQKDHLSTLVSCHLELSELANSLTYYSGSIQPNPERCEEVNARLNEICALEKNYGTTIDDVLSYLKDSKEELVKLKGSENSVETQEKEVSELERKIQEMGDQLTNKRQKGAKKLESMIKNELESLNLNSCFRVQLTEKPMDSTGKDDVEFFFTPNVGEKEISVKECASGGELCRLSLAISCLLAEKSATSTLIFDEIDAHIGGLTALKVGAKLQQLGKNHQIICITHLAQVAQFADHHFQILKKTGNGRTITTISPLSSQKQVKELSRMQGIQ